MRDTETLHSQHDEPTSDTTDDSDDQIGRVEYYQLPEFVTTREVSYDTEVEVGPPSKRLKVTHEPDDDNPFDLVPVQDSTTPRYTRPVKQVTTSYTALSLSLRNLTNCYEYSAKPPSVSEVVSTFDDHGLPSKIYRAPYYSVESDAPDHPREYAGLVYHLRGGEGLDILEEWTSTSASEFLDIVPAYEKASGPESNIWGWQYTGAPPNVKQVRQWLRKARKRVPQTRPKDPSQVRDNLPPS